MMKRFWEAERQEYEKMEEERGMAPEAEQKGNWEERAGRSIGRDEPKDTGRGEGNASPSPRQTNE